LHISGGGGYDSGNNVLFDRWASGIESSIESTYIDMLALHLVITKSSHNVCCVSSKLEVGLAHSEDYARLVFQAAPASTDRVP
jgi:hypothetical protein